MTSRYTAALRRLLATSPLTDEMRLALISPLYARVGSLMLGHASGLLVAVVAVLRIHGIWPMATLVAELLALAARLAVLITTRRHRGADRNAALLRSVGRYYAVGVFWAAVSGVFCALCVIVGQDESTRMLAIVLALGTTGGIASRNAATPRFALIQICAWLLPLTLAGPRLGGGYWLLSAMNLAFLAALCSIVRQHYRDITALLGAERANHALATRFDAAISNMTQGLLLFDGGGRLQVVNRRFCELFAIAPGQLAPGASYADVARHCAALLQPGGAVLEPVAETAGLVCDLRDGRALAVSHAMLADGGRVITFEDITERRRAELELAEREAEFRAIFHNVASGVAETDVATGHFTRVNPVFCSFVGRRAEDLLGGLTPGDVVHPSEHDVMQRARREVVAGGGTLDTELRHVRPDGTERWARVRSSGTKFDAEGRARRILAVVEDITERKAAEAALRANEELLRLSMQAGRIGSYRRNLVAGIVYCGLQARAMHGCPPGDAPLTEAEWTAHVLPQDMERLAAEVVETRRRRLADVGFEYRVRHPASQEVRFLETRARVTYDAEGRPLEAVGVVIDVTERRLAEAQIAHLAHHDPLTDLPNRTLLQLRLDEALVRAHRGDGFALCCLDLDHFKEVNDSYGHPIGDALLRAVAARVQEELQETDTLARLGGDEFALILTNGGGQREIVALADRLIARLAVPFELEGHHVTIGASIGITMAPADGLDAEVLFKSADMALYRAKMDGRGRLCLFEPEMDAQVRSRRALERDLRLALDAGELEVFYQPLVDIRTRQVTCLEALLRWRHPVRGLVGPDRFIPLAEANGLILPIGDWVLRQACSQALQWPGTPKVAVNLSVVAFGSPTLVESVAAALRESGLDPARLELEITETVMLQDTEATLLTLHQIKALGVGIAMDDFGTGFSSLNYLQKFPFDKVKIDRSFVAGLGLTRDSTTIVRAVIDLCAALGMTTTAEGVETQAQLAVLAEHGCEQAQGYLFSPPVPVDKLPGVLAGLAADAAQAAAAPRQGRAPRDAASGLASRELAGAGAAGADAAD